MEYSYSDYLIVLFWTPLLGILFPVPLLIGMVKEAASHKAEGAVHSSIWGITFTLIALLFFLFPQISNIWNAGVSLLFEDENDAVMVCGSIESITEPSDHFHGIKKDGNHGADIRINGVRYFALSGSGFSPGDDVMIWYLPRSRVIIRIYSI